MTDTPTIKPMSEAEKQQLAELQQRQALENWQAAESQRKADLAALEPAVTALGGAKQVEKMITDLEASTATLDRELTTRVDPIISILQSSARPLIERHRQLSVPLPKPGEGLLA